MNLPERCPVCEKPVLTARQQSDDGRRVYLRPVVANDQNWPLSDETRVDLIYQAEQQARGARRFKVEWAQIATCDGLPVKGNVATLSAEEVQRSAADHPPRRLRVGVGAYLEHLCPSELTQAQVDRLPWQAVNSSNVTRVAYVKTDELLVEFGSAAVYRYEHVPPSLLAGLLEADSVGGFIHHQIKAGRKAGRIVVTDSTVSEREASHGS